jgi:hypothetical protein
VRTDRLRTVGKFSLAHARADRHQQLDLVAPVRRQRQVRPSQLTTDDFRLGLLAVEACGPLNVAESRRETVDHGNVAQIGTERVTHRDRVRDHLPARNVDE